MSKTNITVQLTNNDNIVKFVTKSFITQSKSYEFNNIDDAKESPIAQRLFHLPFVKTIYISQNFIAIEKFPFNLENKALVIERKLINDYNIYAIPIPRTNK